jgi:SAM-dependent methyltransferase
MQGDATDLDVRPGTFDLAGCARVLHHVHRPEMVVATLTRAVRFGGHVLVIDQIAPLDPLAALELDRFERARDPEHQRLLSDIDLRVLLEANGLVVLRTRFVEEERDLTWYLDLADCAGEERDRAEALAPRTRTATVGWYLAMKPSPTA